MFISQLGERGHVSLYVALLEGLHGDVKREGSLSTCEEEGVAPACVDEVFKGGSMRLIRP